MGGSQLVILGLLMLVTAFLLHRGTVLRKRSALDEKNGYTTGDVARLERQANSLITELEVRLHDYDREVAARTQTRIAQLDQLVIDAKQEADRLEGLLQEIRALQENTDDQSNAA